MSVLLSLSTVLPWKVFAVPGSWFILLSITYWLDYVSHYKLLWTKASVKLLKHKCKLRCPPSVIGFHFWINYIKIRRHNRHGSVFACMFYLSSQRVTTPWQPPAASAWCRLQTWYAGEVLIKGSLRWWMSVSPAFCCSGCCFSIRLHYC